ncbi:MAG: hypothetical protein VX938_08000, partial [Myxococcota bacterium]|nr:hypothetical protein [Myxococcota bacterium]
SIAGGRRVEIKGVSSHRILPRLVHIEAFRQLNLLRIRAELLSRGVTSTDLEISRESLPWEISDLVADARPALKKCDFAPVQQALEGDEMIAGVRLPGFGGLMSHNTQPGMNFAGEFQGRLRVIACLTGRPFMIHSGVEYGLKGSEWAQIRKAVGAGSRSEDAVIVLWGPERDVATGCREILERATDALVGVPSETRQAFDDATTGFERILPGADRMYPDTDTPPVSLPDSLVAEVHEDLPERPWTRAARYEAMGLSPDDARELADAPWFALFDVLAPATPEAARRLASGLQKRLIQHGRETGEFVLPEATRVAPLVRALEEGGPIRHAFETMLLTMLRDPRAQPDAVLTAAREAQGLEALTKQVLEARGEVRTTDPAATLRWAMGQVMDDLLGTTEPLEVQRALAQALGLGEEAQ